MRINAEVVRAKEKRLEEEKLADMRTMEYLQKKLVSRKQETFSAKYSQQIMSSICLYIYKHTYTCILDSFIHTDLFISNFYFF